MDESTFDAACEMAFNALQTLAAGLKSDVVALYNLNRLWQTSPRQYSRNSTECNIGLAP